MMGRLGIENKMLLVGLTVFIIYAGISYDNAFAINNPTFGPVHLLPRLYTLSDQASCQNSPFNGIWVNTFKSPENCIVNNFAVDSEVDVKISSGVTVYIGGTFANAGYISNYGTVYNEGPTFQIPGVDYGINNSGTLYNYGQFIAAANNSANTGTIYNYGQFSNFDKNFVNMGTIWNPPGGNLGNGGNIINKANGIINNADSSTGHGGTFATYYQSSIVNTGRFINTGTVTADQGSTINNTGIFWNMPDGLLYNSGSMINFGTINNALPSQNGLMNNTVSSSIPGGTITNTGTVTNNAAGIILTTGSMTNSGWVGNSGTITNDGMVDNLKSIVDYCNAVWNGSGNLSGNQIVSMACPIPLSNQINSRIHQPAAGIPPTISPPIPSWIKNTANWWSNGQVSDAEFIKSLQYLIDKRIIQVSQVTPSDIVTGQVTSSVPSWIKNAAGMWSTGKISDQEFLSSVQYLLGKEMIKTASPDSSQSVNQIHIVSTLSPKITFPPQPMLKSISGSSAKIPPIPCNNQYASSIPNTSLPPKFVKSWDSDGVGLEFKNPNSIALDSCGNVYVTDTGNHQVEKFDGNGQYLNSWGHSGSSISLTNPTSIAVDSNGRVWVTDLTRVISFDKNGQLLSSWGQAITDCCASLAKSKSPFIVPLAVTLDWTKSDVIVSYSDGSSEVSYGGGKWKNTLQVSAEYLAVDPNENVWLSGDNNQQCLAQIGCYEVYTGFIGGTHGSVLYTTGINEVSLNSLLPCQSDFIDSGGTCYGEYAQFPPSFTPLVGNYSYTAVAIDPVGRVFLADSIGDRIVVFDNHGNYITSWGSKGSGNGQFNNPTGIAVDKFDDVYVVDSGNNRIEKFAPSGD